MFIPLLRTGTSGSNALPLVLPSSTPSILRSTIMDVLYADRRHAPVSEGIPKRHQNTKKQKVVRSNNRSSPISGISDDGSSSLKSGHSNNKHLGGEGRYSTHGGGVPCVVLGGSTSSAGSPAVSFTAELSPSITEGSLTICVECKTNPSNHHCCKYNAIVCGVCCASKRGLEGTWWCGTCFNKRSAKIQKAIRDNEYYSDDDDNPNQQSSMA